MPARARLGLLLGIGAAGLLGCGPEPSAGPPAPPGAALAAADWVGGPVCAECHPEPARLWRGSDHDQAMQEANADTVLGDFEDARFEHHGVVSRFFRRDGRYFVRTDGPDGEPQDFEIAYTFGFDPLQQYLVRFPGGRLQALPTAWDARPASEGGQRWYSLYPDEPIAPDDVLHWTGAALNWNQMCGECHSTGFRKNYLAEESRYESHWQEIDVSCEACHGPGSRHVAWARGEAPADLPERGLLVDLGDGPGVSWELAPGENIAKRSRPRRSQRQLETCARCHARRSVLREDYPYGRPLMDSHRPALLDAGLYFADGRIHDEVYVYGSFVQSRMFAAGVTCSDCHDPHSLALPEGPDAACARCHRPEHFARVEHHGHPPDSPGARCVACHMPQETYMGVDVRRDHSFRVPRPDLSPTLGTPDACTDCHADRDAAWAAGSLAARGVDLARRPQFGEALHAGRLHLPGAGARLVALSADREQPAIARATALRLLRELPGAATAAAVRTARDDPDPLVRAAAAEAAEGLAPEEQVALIEPLLRDPVLGVRTEAARVLAAVPTQAWSGGAGALGPALAEYRAAQRANADRPGAQLNLGVLHAQFGELGRARESYERALALEPRFEPAWVNLADLARLQGRDDEAERVLLRGLELLPESAALHHALGLTRVRQGRLEAALPELGRAAELAPDIPRYAYLHGIALHEAGRSEQGIAVLEEAHRRHPGDRDLLLALVTVQRDRGLRAEARLYAQRLVALAPDDPVARALLAELGDGNSAGGP